MRAALSFVFILILCGAGFAESLTLEECVRKVKLEGDLRDRLRPVLMTTEARQR